MDITKLCEGDNISWIDKSGWENPDSNSLFPYSKSTKAKLRKGKFIELKKRPHISHTNGLLMITVLYRGKKNTFNPKYYNFL